MPLPTPEDLADSGIGQNQGYSGNPGATAGDVLQEAGVGWFDPGPGAGGGSGGGGGNDGWHSAQPGQHGNLDDPSGMRPFTLGTSGGDPGTVLGVAGGESNPLSHLATPTFDDRQSYAYVDPNSFINRYDADIYGYLGQGLDSRANTGFQGAGYTQLGGVAQAGAAQAAPGMMLSGAQIQPQMMVGAAQANMADDYAYRQAQAEFVNYLNAQAQGVGPSVAEVQAKQQADAALAQQLGALGSQRGASSAALGQRAAAMAGAQAQQQAAAAGALGRAQEAQAAQQTLAQALVGARGQSQTADQFQAQLQQQALMANQQGFNQAALQQAQLNQQAAQGNQGTATQMALANQQAAQQAAQFNAGAQNQAMLQQGQMDQQTAIANLQAMLQNRQINEQTYQAMLAGVMQHSQAGVSNAGAFEQMLAQQQQAILSLNAGEAIASGQQTQGLMGAAAAAGGALLAMSDRRVKTSIRSAREDVYGFLDALDDDDDDPDDPAPAMVASFLAELRRCA